MPPVLNREKNFARIQEARRYFCRKIPSKKNVTFSHSCETTTTAQRLCLHSTRSVALLPGTTHLN